MEKATKTTMMMRIVNSLMTNVPPKYFRKPVARLHGRGSVDYHNHRSRTFKGNRRRQLALSAKRKRRA